MKTFVKVRTTTITFGKNTAKSVKNKPESQVNKYRAIRKLLGLYREK